MPSTTRENVGTLKPSDLLGAISLYQFKYDSGEE